MLAPPSCSFHNPTARYFYSFGREGLLPSALGRTHHKFKSPHIASIVQSVIAAIIIILFALLTGSKRPGVAGLPAALRADGRDGRASRRSTNRRAGSSTKACERCSDRLAHPGLRPGRAVGAGDGGGTLAGILIKRT